LVGQQQPFAAMHQADTYFENTFVDYLQAVFTGQQNIHFA
jgi:hypothetical protein